MLNLADPQKSRFIPGVYIYIYIWDGTLFVPYMCTFILLIKRQAPVIVLTIILLRFGPLELFFALCLPPYLVASSTQQLLAILIIYSIF